MKQSLNAFRLNFPNPAIALALCLLLGASASAQILTFDLAGANGDEATWPSNFNDPNLTGSVISRGPGITAVANAGRFNSKLWTTNSSIDLDDYVEFTITPQPDKQFSITKVRVQFQRSNTGPRGLALRTSADGFSSNAGDVASLPDGTITYTRAFNFSLTGQEGPLVVRLYGFSAEYSTVGQGGPGDGTGADIEVFGSTANVDTKVQFASTSSSSAEDGGPLSLALNIVHPSSVNPTTVTIGATDPTGRIASFSTPVVFPAGSSADEFVTVNLDDNGICDGDVPVVFTITGVTGGQGIPQPGANATHTLTVLDNDPLQVPVATDAASITTSNFTATWNAAGGATGYYLDVSTSPTFGGAAQLVAWSFPVGSQDPEADGGIAANLSRTVTCTASDSTAYPAGSLGMPDRSMAVQDWSNGNGSKWWQVDLKTSGFFGLSLSSKQRSNLVGPRDFKVQYRIGPGGSWTDVPGGTVTVSNNFTTGVINALALPAACDDQPQVFLRWIMDSDTRASGLGSVTNASWSRIDDISVDATSSTAFVTGYENLFVGNLTSYPVTGLSASTDYYYRVRSVGDACPQSANSNVIHVLTTGADTYYSRGDGHVADAIWSDTPTGTPGMANWTAASSMVVQSGDSVTSTAEVQLKNLDVQAGGKLVLLAGTKCFVNGSSVTFSGDATAMELSKVLINSSTAVTFTSNNNALTLWDLVANTPAGCTVTGALGIRGTLQAQNGAFDASSATVTLLSDAQGTGRLGALNGGSSYLGNITVQRFIPAGTTNWRMLSSPVAGNTVADWADDFFTAGFPGSAYPNFYDPPNSGILWPSIRWYDETDPTPDFNTGMVGVSSTAQALTAGQGFNAWSGSTLTTTTAFTVKVTGTPNTALTPLTLPMSFTSSGSVPDDGWNLVGNPLPSPIDFESLSLGTDVQDQYWIFDPVSGNTFGWSSGVGQGGLNGIIQSSQGFWMKADGPQVTTTVGESAKVLEAADGGLFGGAQMGLPTLRLLVTSDANAYRDEATLILDQGMAGLDRMDALKFVFSAPGAPRISLRTDEGRDLAIDFHGPCPNGFAIPVAVHGSISGTYTITAQLAGWGGSPDLFLEDLVTGTETPLFNGTAHSFTLNAEANSGVPRFILHGAGTTTGVSPVNHDGLTVHAVGSSLVIDHAFGNRPVDVDVFDVTGRSVISRGAIVQPGRITIDDRALDTGVWLVRVTSGGEQRTFRVPLVR